MKIGYFKTASQAESLKQHGCDQTLPDLRACLEIAKPGDTLVVSSISDIADHLSDILETLAYLTAVNVFFYSLTEGIEAGRKRVFREVLRMRGARIGPEPKYGPDIIQKVKAMTSEGRTTRDIAAQFPGMGNATAHRLARK